MASMVVGGLFNAVAFAGAGYLFKMMDKGGYEEETKRHNKAMESLSAAKEKWYENEVAKKDRIAEMRQQLSDANADINATNKALNTLRTITHNDKTFTREPHLTDYYQPSDEMREYLLITVSVGGVIVGWTVHKFISGWAVHKFNSNSTKR